MVPLCAARNESPRSAVAQCYESLRSAVVPLGAARYESPRSVVAQLGAVRCESLRLVAALSDLRRPRASLVPDSAASWTRHPLRLASERGPLQSHQDTHSGCSVWECCCLENADWTCLFLNRIGLTEPLGSAVCQQQFLCQPTAAPTAVSSQLRDTSENWELAVSNPLAACSQQRADKRSAGRRDHATLGSDSPWAAESRPLRLPTGHGFLRCRNHAMMRA